MTRRYHRVTPADARARRRPLIGAAWTRAGNRSHRPAASPNPNCSTLRRRARPVSGRSAVVQHTSAEIYTQKPALVGSLPDGWAASALVGRPSPCLHPTVASCAWAMWGVCRVPMGGPGRARQRVGTLSMFLLWRPARGAWTVQGRAAADCRRPPRQCGPPLGPPSDGSATPVHPPYPRECFAGRRLP